MINDLFLHEEQFYSDAKVKSWINSDSVVFDIELTKWIRKNIDICVMSWHQTVYESLLWKEQTSFKRSLAVSVMSISRLNKTEALINLHQVWLRYDSNMTQHSFSFSTLFSFINILFIYITFFSCHKHISFRPSAVSEHYINRSFCINLLLYS